MTAAVDPCLRLGLRTIQDDMSPLPLALKDIGRALTLATRPAARGPYGHNRTTGSVPVRDQAAHNSPASGAIPASGDGLRMPCRQP